MGRERELDFLDRALASDAAGLLLAGPAGVGKTYLAGACLNRAAADGWSTARVTATRSSAEVPLGALAALLPPAASNPGALYNFHQVVDALNERAGDNRLATRHLEKALWGHGDACEAAFLLRGLPRSAESPPWQRLLRELHTRNGQCSAAQP